MKKVLVACALIYREGFYLATRRSKGKDLSGYWEFPGGKLEPSESLNDCIEREILEELGCQVSAKEYFGMTENYQHDRIIQLHAICCEILQNEPYPSLQDHDLVCWITPFNMHRLRFAPADQTFINRLISKQCTNLY